VESLKYIFKHKLILMVIGALFIIDCAGNKPIDTMSLEKRFERGQEYLKKNKYHQAQQEFQIIVLSGSHTDLGDDAQFYLAESFFKNKEYLIAISEYERLTRKMKFSPYVEKARWRICEAYVAESPKYYHDQTNTDKALQKLQEFIDEYPNSEFRDEVNNTIKNLRNKLAEKILKSAILYTKLHAYDSAIIAYNDLLSKYYDTEHSNAAHVGIIHANILMKNFDEARTYFTENESKIVEPELKKKAREYIAAIKLGGN